MAKLLQKPVLFLLRNRKGGLKVVSDKKKCSLAFGELMANARERKGLQQWEVAEQLGISQPYYCYLEKGQRVIDLDVALKACKLLGIDLNEFVRTYK